MSAHAGSLYAQETPVTVLPTVRIKASLFPDALAEAHENRQFTPGHVSVIEQKSYQRGAVLGLADALSRTPGVYTQNPSGQISARVSIRGSGITSPTGTRGVRLLRDGLPLGRTDEVGDSIYTDPLGVDYIEVLRGANAFRYGGATLGGAVNLVSPNGYTRPGFKWRLDGGAYGYRAGRIEAGGATENGWDAFASISSTDSSGYREHSAYSTSRFYGNVGYRFNDAVKGRLHVTQEYYRVDMPGALTYDQLQDNPRQANAQSRRAGARVRTTPRWHLAYLHDIGLSEHNKLSLGVFHTGTKFDSWGTASQIEYAAIDYGVSFRHEGSGRLAGHDNRFFWGASATRGVDRNFAYWPDLTGMIPFAPPAGSLQADLDMRRSQVELYFENHFSLTPALTLVAGTQGIWANRHNDNAVSPLARNWFADGQASARYSGFNPKIGLVWQAAPNVEWYANVSRSFEPPSALAFYSPAGQLAAQRATSFEVGSRGGSDALKWDVAVYQARVRDELVETLVPGNAGITITSNAPRTTHRGFELGLNGAHPLSAFPGQLEWTLAYTFNDFRFSGHQLFGDNALPGIPRHVSRLDVLYRHPQGFYAGPGIEIGSGWNVDQANSMQAPGYGLLHFRAGYNNPNQRFRIYVDARNLLDKPYATTTDYVVDARRFPANKEVFTPGLGRSVFVAIEMVF